TLNNGGDLTLSGNVSIATGKTYSISGSTSQTYASAVCVTTTGGIVTGTGACTGGSTTDYWTLANGSLYPINTTLDVLIGGTSTASAKFAFMNVNSGTPVASISANSGNNAVYLTGDGTLATTNRGTLTLGNSSTYNTTGNLLINPNGTGNVTIGGTSPYTTDTGLLSVYGGIRSSSTGNASLVLDAGTGGAGGNQVSYIDFRNSATLKGNIAVNEATSGTPLELNSAVSNDVGIAAGGGNVGIGTNGPISKLTISGDAKSLVLNTATLNPAGRSEIGFCENCIVGDALSMALSYDGSGIGDSNKMNIIGAGVDLVTFTRGGLVGIGTTSPLSLLHVSGGNKGGNSLAIFDQRGAATNDILTASASGATRLTLGNAGDLTVTGNVAAGTGKAFYVGTTAGSTVASASCVITTGGIVTSTGACTGIFSGGYWTLANGSLYPINTTLDVLIGGTATSGANFAKFGFINVNSGTPTASVSAGAAGSIYIDATGKIATTAKQSLTIGDSITTGNVIINPSGNVGIGTTGPTYPLQVDASGVQLGATNFYQEARFGSVANSAGVILGRDAAIQSGIVGAHVLEFWTNTTNTTGAEAMRIQENGNVGIGTTSPGAALDVKGPNTAGTASLLLRNGDDQNGSVGVTQIRLGYGNTDQYQHYIRTRHNASTANNAIDFYTSDGTAGGVFPTNAVLGLSINNGNVGIGTTSPLTTLDVTGSASLSANLSLRGAATAHNLNILDNGTLNIQRSPGGLQPTTGVVSVLFIQNNGNIGIGTTTPGYILDARNGSAATSAIVNFEADADRPAFQVVNSDGGAASNQPIFKLFGDNTADKAFQAGLSTDSTARFNLTVNGLMEFGPGGVSARDTNLYRSAANTLKTDDNFTSAINIDAVSYSVGGVAGLASGTNTCVNVTNGIVTGTGTCSGVFSGGYWNLANGTLYPINTTLDVLIGGTATSGANFAKFGFINVNSGTPTASISAGVAGALIMDATGKIYSTAKQTLALGDSTATGNVVINPGGNVGIGTTNPTAIFNLYNASDPRIRITRPSVANLDFSVNAGGLGIIDITGAGNNLTINSSGYVGIGTTNPIEALSVSGNASLSGTLATSTIKAPTGALNLQYKSGANAWTNALTVLDNSGNVGIGTTSPDELLHVSGSNAGDGAHIGNAYVGIWDGNNGYATFTHNALKATTTSYALLQWSDGSTYVNAASTKNLYFRINNNDKMTLDSTGNVGIGTTTPLAALDITGSASVSANLSLKGAGTAHLFNILDNGTLNIQRSPGGLQPTTGIASALFIQNDGNVGIGTTTPTEKLQIEQDGNVYLNIHAVTGSGQIAGIKLQRGTTSDSYYDYNLYDSSGAFYLDRVKTGNTLSLLYFDGDGKTIIKGDTGLYVQEGGGNRALKLIPPVGGAQAVIDTDATNAGIDLNYSGTLAIRLWDKDLIGFGSNTTTPLTLMHVSGGNRGGRALAIFDQIGANTNDILTASASGATKMTLNNGGDLTLSGNVSIATGKTYSISGSTSQTYASAVCVTTTGGIVTGTGACTGGSTTDYWTLANGTLYPVNTTLDVLIGGTATSGANFAKFGFINVNSGTPTATISAGVAGGVYLTSTGTLATTAKQTLMLGDSTTTGNISINTLGNIALGTPSAAITSKVYVSGNDGSNPVVLSIANIANNASTGIDLLENGSNQGTQPTFGGSNSYGFRIRYDGGNNQFLIQSGSTSTVNTRLAINRDDGNVGIGTTSPEYKLHVDAGTAEARVAVFKSTFAGGGSYISIRDKDTTFDQVRIGAIAQNLVFWAGNSEKVRIDNNGNVGIGNTSPAYKLDVNGTIETGLFGGNDGTVLFRPSLDKVWFWIDNPSANYLRFSSGATPGTNPIVYTSNGSFGIGTTSPLSLLHATGGNIGGRALAIFDQIGAATNDIITASSSGATKFTVTNAGNVNASQYIDLDNTAYFLDPAATGIALNLNGTASTAANLTFSGAGTAHTFNILDNGTLNIQRSPGGLQPTTGVASALFIQNNGNIGIGTTSPGAKVDIATSTDNAEILRLDTDRPWSFFQRGTGASTSLDLRSSYGDKDFTITNNSAENVFKLTAGSPGANYISFMKDRVSILDGGNVGIGTTGPASNLDIVGAPSSDNATKYNLRIFDTTTAGAGTGGGIILGGYYSGTSLTANFAAINGIKENSTAGNYASALTFQTRVNTGALTERVRIDSNGNVGIGTTSPLGVLHVKGGNTGGNAALIVDQTGASSNDIFAASNSGALAFRIKNNGDIVVGPTGGGKITVTTWDPLYNIDGNHYATYGTSMLGVKEEITGKASLSYNNQQGAYSYTLDYNSFERDSDLWVFSRVTDPNIDLTSVLLTPNSQAKTWYQKDPTNKKITFFADRPTELSYRLTAPRFDHAKWGTISDETGGYEVPPLPDQSGLPVYSENPSSEQNAIAKVFDSTGREIYALVDSLGNIIKRTDSFSSLLAANLEAGFLKASEVSTNSLAIATDSVTIGGQNIQDYIVSVVNTAISNGTIQPFGFAQGKQFNNGVVSPIAQADIVRTNLISPLAQDSNISLALGNSKLEIRNSTASDAAAVAIIDNAGNASFSGSLTAQNGQFNNLTMKQFNNEGDASIAGTLRANKIVANEIEGLNMKTSTIAAQYITNNYYSSPSSELLNGYIAAITTNSGTTRPFGFAQGEQSNNLAMEQYINISSFSSQLAYIENFKSDYGQFNQGLIALGPTSLNDVSIAGQLYVGSSLAMTGNSINVLGTDFEIQPLRQGGISMMGGKVYIDIDGNMRVDGNTEFAKDLKVKGTLVTNIISPIPESDLIIKLGSNSQGIQNSEFRIQNSSGSAVLTVNQKGDVTASGSARFAEDIEARRGTFAKLNLNLIAPAFAISNSEAIATGSAGVATISAHLNELTINNPLVTEKSLIYITPVSDTDNQVLYLRRQKPGESFTVGIGQGATKPMPFNWMIVN
ncbi:MAG: hypothetical protein M1268_03865, partial [Patescibacteria group bacterium]|nr:hypothetical protein [Patescibacteria group bacterium]